MPSFLFNQFIVNCSRIVLSPHMFILFFFFFFSEPYILILTSLLFLEPSHSYIILIHQNHKIETKIPINNKWKKKNGKERRENIIRSGYHYSSTSPHLLIHTINCNTFKSFDEAHVVWQLWFSSPAINF